jgi:MEMO1 family protein
MAVDAMLAAWQPGTAAPWALLVPHAGHVYSGACAAAAYARVAGRDVKRILLFGPNHHVPLEGIGLSRQESWATPLGELPVDLAGVTALLEGGDPFREAEAAIDLEHSLEVQLPFIQRVLPDSLLLPMLVGRCSPQQRADALVRLAAIDRPGDLWVVTTDLSHFHDRRQAELLDARAARLVGEGDPAALLAALEEGTVEACGAEPLLLLLEANRSRGGGIELLDRRDSSLVNGDEQEVVGYLSATFQMGGGNA